MKKINNESFGFIITMMQIIGWYPQNTNQVCFGIRSYSLHFIFLVLFFTLMSLEVLINKNYGSMQIMCLSEIGNYCLKVLPFVIRTQRHNIEKCINHFSSSDFIPNDDIEEKLLNDSVTICQKLTKVFFSGMFIVGFAYLVPLLIVKDYEFPMQIWLPYYLTTGSRIYFVKRFYVPLATFYVMCPTCLIDPLLGGLIYQAVTQLKILKHRIILLDADRNSKTIENFTTRAHHETVKKCVQQHEAILEFVQNYENCFGWSIFSQFVGTTIGLCFCCIMFIQVSMASIDGVKLVLIFLLVSFQVMFYCFFGTLLYEENKTLVTTIYMNEWYEYDVKTRKLLIMFMERSKQPMILTAGKLVDLTLDTFVTVLKRSYSLVAVFKQSEQAI